MTQAKLDRLAAGPDRRLVRSAAEAGVGANDAASCISLCIGGCERMDRNPRKAFRLFGL